MSARVALVVACVALVLSACGKRSDPAAERARVAGKMLEAAEARDAGSLPIAPRDQ